MGKVLFNMSMSLDGFVAGANDSVENSLGDDGERLFAWYGSGDTVYKTPGGDWRFRVSAASAALLERSIGTTGALVTGRRTFEIARAWGGQHPLAMPVVVMTHRAPQEWIKAGSPFTFVSDGIESAVAAAKRLAGDKNVAVGTATTFQQAFNAGLIDEICVDLVPLLLGSGVRLFEHLGVLPADLEQVSVVAGTGVTHLAYRVVK